jgi:hypothetical protein
VPVQPTIRKTGQPARMKGGPNTACLPSTGAAQNRPFYTRVYSTLQPVVLSRNADASFLIGEVSSRTRRGLNCERDGDTFRKPKLGMLLAYSCPRSNVTSSCLRVRRCRRRRRCHFARIVASRPPVPPFGARRRALGLDEAPHREHTVQRPPRLHVSSV